MSMHHSQNFNVHIGYIKLNIYWYYNVNQNWKEKNVKYVCRMEQLFWQ